MKTLGTEVVLLQVILCHVSVSALSAQSIAIITATTSSSFILANLLQ